MQKGYKTWRNISRWLMAITIAIFFLLVALAAILLATTIMTLFWDERPHDKLITVQHETNFYAIIFTGITICLTLSAIVPFVISKFLTKVGIENAVERVLQTTDKVTNSKFERVDADHSRAISYLLNMQEKPIWSISWNMRAKIRYLRSNTESKKAMYDDLLKMSVCITMDSIDMFIQKVLASVQKDQSKDKKLKDHILEVFNSDTCEEKNCLVVRVLSDLIDYKVENKKNKNIIFKIKESDIEQEIIDRFTQIIIDVLSKKDIKKSEEISWYSKEEGEEISFEKELEKYVESSKKITKNKESIIEKFKQEYNDSIVETHEQVDLLFVSLAVMMKEYNK